MTALTLPTTLQAEFNDLMLGAKIGAGEYREVYEFALNPDWVVKIEIADSRFFANAMEWAIWNDLKGTRHERWLAPCHYISFSGSILIQSRTQPLDELPRRVPEFLADVKRANYGLLDGRVVAHDYANHHLFTRGVKGAKLKLVEPRDRER